MLPDEGMWAEMWHKKRKWQPTNGQENCKITALPTGNSQRPKIFDYSLGGYYHRERWARTRRY
jgi:hypothetical protein